MNMLDNSISGLVFNIQRFSLHDGPGIRTTVFLNGCPLRCVWCSNPESLSGKPELFYNPQNCIKCNLCYSVCDDTAIRKDVYTMNRIDRNVCTRCGKCAQACPTSAISIKGKNMTATEVIDEVLKDKPFFVSGGGVTFSGGEPFFQKSFLNELLRLSKINNLHTSIETSAYAPWDTILSSLPYLDFMYIDFKHPLDKMHIKYTGVSNKLIKSNLENIVHQDVKFIVRIPLIPTVNCDEKTLECSAKFLSSIGIKEVELLNYHTFGESKYNLLGLNYNFSCENSLYDSKQILRLAVDVFTKYKIKAYNTQSI